MTGSLSSPGVGSGLDVKGIVDKLVAIERRPIEVLAAQQKTVQGRVSSFGLIKNFMDNLKDAASQLADVSLWKSSTAASADPSVALVATNADAESHPAAGSYRLHVAQLAQVQTLVARPTSDTKAALGAGRLRLELGTWNDGATAFTPKAGAAPTTISFTAGASSLEDVRDRINAAHAGASATILRDASGARLVVRSTATGEENALRVTATGPAGDGDPPPAGLAALTFDPPDALPGSDALTRAQPARNARATINGVDIESGSNVLDGAVEGLKITLQKVSASPVDITVSPDTARMKKALEAFVGAYNDITDYLAAQTKVDTTAHTAAPLQGDATTTQLQKTLRNALAATSGASSSFTRLLDAGVHLGADGRLALDATKAGQALSRPDELAKAFAARDPAHPANDGFGVRFVALAQKSLDFQGPLATRTRALQETIGRYQDRQSAMEDRVSQYQARLLKAYTALDTRMASLNAQSQYVTQQMKMLAKNSGTN